MSHTSHAFFIENPVVADGRLTVEGEEARHAVRVKRIRPGAAVEVLDGCGTRLLGTVEGADRTVRLRITAREAVPRPCPHIEVMSATPKGARLDRMIDALCQVGASAWTPTHFERSVVDPRDTKLQRLDRIIAEAAKQSRRPWRLELGQRALLREVLEASPDGAVIVADVSGEPYAPGGAAAIRLIVGPEGGLTPGELDLARAHGAQIRTFGPHIMRTDVAAPVAAAIILAAEGTRTR